MLGDRIIAAALTGSILMGLGLLGGCGSGTSSQNVAVTSLTTTTTLVTTTTSTSTTTSVSTPSFEEFLEEQGTSLDELIPTLPTGVQAWGDAVEVYGLTVTVEAPQEDTEAPLVDEGNKVVYCMVTITNNDGEPYEYNALCFEMLDAESQPYESYASTSQPKLVHGFIQPGRSLKAAVAYELPKAAEAATIIFSPIYASPDQLIWGK
jgi:hypothetical protein